MGIKQLMMNMKLFATDIKKGSEGKSPATL